MPKIRLIKVYDHSTGDCEKFYYDELSNWEEVSQQDLDFILANNHDFRSDYDCYRVIVLEDITHEEKIEKYITNIKEFVKNKQEKIEKDKKKNKELNDKRLASAEARRIEKAKRLLLEKGLL